MVKQISSEAGDFFFATDTKVIVNRTGATTVAGGVAFIDLATADTDSATLAAGAGNAVATTTALIAVGVMCVWKDAGVVDNAAGRAFIGEGFITDVLVDSTTDITKGDPLKPVNGGDHMVKATAGSDRYHAIALESRTANSEGTIKALVLSYGRI